MEIIKGIKKLFYILILPALLSCYAPFKWVDTLPKPWSLSKSKISELLPIFHKKFPDYHDRLKAFSLWQVGKPYKLFCLGEEKAPDIDPIFRLDVSDCTVHILTSLASVESKTWSEAKSNLIKIHYKPDSSGGTIPSYDSRWHFTADRLKNHPSTKDITSTLINQSLLDSVFITLNEKENGNEFLNLNWKDPVTIHYISSVNVTSEILSKLPAIAGVAFVKKSYFKMGLVVAHEGMIIDKKEILHASSDFGKTVIMNFKDYLFQNDSPKFDGVIFYAFHPMEN